MDIVSFFQKKRGSITYIVAKWYTKYNCVQLFSGNLVLSLSVSGVAIHEDQPRRMLQSQAQESVSEEGDAMTEVQDKRTLFSLYGISYHRNVLPCTR